MAYYWFAKNIPELQDVVVADRREWLRVAEERSRFKHAAIASRVMGALVVFAVIVFPDRWYPGTLTMFACLLGAFVSDRFLDAYRQAHARQWLREHLHEFRTSDDGAPAGVSRA